MLNVYYWADYEYRPEVPMQNTAIQPTLLTDIHNALRKCFKKVNEIGTISFYPLERTENTGFSVTVKKVIILLDANTYPIGELTGDAAKRVFEWLESQDSNIWGIRPWDAFYLYYNR